MCLAPLRSDLLTLDADAWKAERDRHCPPLPNDRPTCKYDSKPGGCRHTDPVHLLYYSHPNGDAFTKDMEPTEAVSLPAPMERSACGKGADCKRYDQGHFLWYSHPNNLVDARAAALEARASTDGEEWCNLECYDPLEPSTAATVLCSSEVPHRYCEKCVLEWIHSSWGENKRPTPRCPNCNGWFVSFTVGRCKGHRTVEVETLVQKWVQQQEAQAAQAAQAAAEAEQQAPPPPRPNAAAPLSDAEVVAATQADEQQRLAREAQQVDERDARAVNRIEAAAAASAAAAAAQPVQPVQPAAAPVVAPATPAASAAAQPAAAQPAASDAASSSSLSLPERRRRLLNLIQAGDDRVVWSSLDAATQDKLMKAYNKALGLDANALLPGVVVGRFGPGSYSSDDITVVITSLNNHALARHGLDQIPSGELGALKKDMHAVHSQVRRAGLEAGGYLYPILKEYQPPPPLRTRQYFFLWSAQSFEERKTRAGALTPERLSDFARWAERRHEPNVDAIRELLRQGCQDDPITGLPLPNPDSALFRDGWEALREVVETINCSGNIAHGRIEEARAKLQQIKAATLTGEAGSS